MSSPRMVNQNIRALPCSPCHWWTPTALSDHLHMLLVIHNRAVWHCIRLLYTYHLFRFTLTCSLSLFFAQHSFNNLILSLMSHCKEIHRLCLPCFRKPQEQKPQEQTTHYLSTHLIPGLKYSVTSDDSSRTVILGSLMFKETWWYTSASWSLICNIFSWFQTTSDSAQPAHKTHKPMHGMGECVQIFWQCVVT